MLRLMASLSVAMLGVAVTGEAGAQGAPQTISSVRVDVQKLATGFRSTKIVGAAVKNQGDERIGTVDDLIVTADDRVLFAVLSVGGFLGLNRHLVAVPYGSLDINESGIVLAGATKDALKAMPEFKYATGSALR